jgi:hypothetical protein
MSFCKITYFDTYFSFWFSLWKTVSPNIIKTIFILFFIVSTLIVNGQNYRDRLISEQALIEKEILFQDFVQMISEVPACFPINVVSKNYSGKVVVYSNFLFDFYNDIYLSAEEKKFVNQNDYFIFAYKLILGDTLYVDSKYDKLIFRNRAFIKVSNTTFIQNFPKEKKQELIESVIDTNGFFKSEGDIGYINYNKEEIISKFFEWGLYINTKEDSNNFWIFNLRSKIIHDDLTDLVNNSLFQYYDSLKVKNLGKEILIINNEYYSGFEMNDCELIKRKVKILDENQISDFIKTFGNNYLFLDLRTIDLTGNELLLTYYLSDIMENPYLKGNYRQMIFDKEVFQFKLNEQKEWVRVLPH